MSLMTKVRFTLREAHPVGQISRMSTILLEDLSVATAVDFPVEQQGRNGTIAGSTIHPYHRSSMIAKTWWCGVSVSFSTTAVIGFT